MTDTSPYRYYLCVQDIMLNWQCHRTTEKEALNPFVNSPGDLPYTKAVPIPKWYPRSLDPLILHSTLHPKVTFHM